MTPLVHQTPNTEKVYPCIHCGSESANVVREGDDPRLKCNQCNGMYQASQSLALQQAGELPEPHEPTTEEKLRAEQAAKIAEREPIEKAKDTERFEYPTSQEDSPRVERRVGIPRSPDFVLVTKDRKDYRFVTKKDLKKVVLEFESREKKYDVYQLTAKQASVKVDFDE